MGAYFPKGCLSSTSGTVVFQSISATNPSGSPLDGFSSGLGSQPFDTSSSLFALASGHFTDPTPSGVFPHAQIAQASTTNRGESLEIRFFAVDSNTPITETQSITLSQPAGGNQIAAISMAAGRFAGSQHDQLIVAYAPSGGTAEYTLIDFDADGKPVQMGTYSTGVNFSSLPNNGYGYPGSIIVRKANLSSVAGSDQAVLSMVNGLGGADGVFGLQAIEFDSNLSPATVGNLYNPNNNPCHYAMTTGRFDRDPVNASTVNLFDQIADLSTQCSSSSPITVSIYGVDPKTLNISTRTTYPVPHSTLSGGPYYSNALPTDNGLQLALAAGDLQNRSLRLGPPSKAEIFAHTQPNLVLALPPMHVDWITPEDGDTPQVLNVSVYPKKFNATYDFSTGSNDNASSKMTTSYTEATKETVGEYRESSLDSAASKWHFQEVRHLHISKGKLAGKYDLRHTYPLSLDCQRSDPE